MGPNHCYTDALQFPKPTVDSASLPRHQLGPVSGPWSAHRPGFSTLGCLSCATHRADFCLSMLVSHSAIPLRLAPAPSFPPAHTTSTKLPPHLHPLSLLLPLFPPFSARTRGPSDPHARRLAVRSDRVRPSYALVQHHGDYQRAYEEAAQEHRAVGPGSRDELKRAAHEGVVAEAEEVAWRELRGLVPQGYLTAGVLEGWKQLALRLIVSCTRVRPPTDRKSVV